MVISPKYSPDFENFWHLYPSRVTDTGLFIKTGKWDAFVQWRKLSVEIRQKCLMLVKNKMVKCSKFTQDACRFLSHRRWEDYPDYAPEAKPKTVTRQSEPTKLSDVVVATLEQKQAIARNAGFRK